MMSWLIYIAPKMVTTLERRYSHGPIYTHPWGRVSMGRLSYPSIKLQKVPLGTATSLCQPTFHVEVGYQYLGCVSQSNQVVKHTIQE